MRAWRGLGNGGCAGVLESGRRDEADFSEDIQCSGTKRACSHGNNDTHLTRDSALSISSDAYTGRILI